MRKYTGVKQKWPSETVALSCWFRITNHQHMQGDAEGGNHQGGNHQSGDAEGGNHHH